MARDGAKWFRDNIHGYIEVPETIVENIIDTDIFQRLKDVDQTGMSPLYPAARHSRFSHSLGVYHLGKQAFRSLEHNIRISEYYKYEKNLLGLAEYRTLYGEEPDDQTEKEIRHNWWRKYQVLFELACLLHDCAHAPYSHAYERYYAIETSEIDEEWCGSVGRKLIYSEDTGEFEFQGLKLQEFKDRDISLEIRRLDKELLSVCNSREFFMDYIPEELWNPQDDFRGPKTSESDERKVQHKGCKEHEKLSSTVLGRGFNKACMKVLQARASKNALVVPEGLVSPEESIKDPRPSWVHQADIEFMVRCIIGLKYSCDPTEFRESIEPLHLREREREKLVRAYVIETSLKNCFIELLNSNKFDVDGLDYIARDAKNAGFGAWDIDYDRMFAALSVMRVAHYHAAPCRGEERSGLWLAGSLIHIAPKGIEGHVPSEDEKLEIRGNFELIYDLPKDKDTSDWLEGVEETEKGEFSSKSPGANPRFLNDATICQVEPTPTSGDTSKVTITVKKAPETWVRVKTVSRLAGAFTGDVNGRKICQPSEPDPEGTQDHLTFEYAPAYDASCLRVIDQIMASRNYQQEWIFTHPKLLYTFFLLGYMPRLASRYVCCKMHPEELGFDENPLEFTSCGYGDVVCSRCNPKDAAEPSEDSDNFVPLILGFDSFFASSPEEYFAKAKDGEPENRARQYMDQGYCFWRSSDSDMRSLFKRIYLENKLRKAVETETGTKDLHSEAIEKYFGSYFNRQHQRPLWKSQAEYREIFSGGEFKDPALRERLESLLMMEDEKAIKNFKVLGGPIRDFLEEHHIKNPVIVPASANPKRIVPEELFVVTRQRGILPLPELGLTSARSSVPQEKFFYIYCDKPKDKEPEPNLQVEALRDLFLEMLKNSKSWQKEAKDKAKELVESEGTDYPEIAM